jgi:phosphatidyl-myo-inositol dimannoside synthase
MGSMHAVGAPLKERLSSWRTRGSPFRSSSPSAKVCWLATEDDQPPAPGPDFHGPPVVLCVGRIDLDQDYKGHAELIEVWPTVVAGTPGAPLIFAGGGTGLERLRDRARSSPARASIDILGFVPEVRMPALWRSAHLFAMPSRKEGFGIVYAEAMRQGLPVIASLHDAGREVNVDEETGFNVNLDRKGELAERLIALLRDTTLAARMGAAGRRRWQTHFRYGAFAARLCDCVGEFWVMLLTRSICLRSTLHVGRRSFLPITD